MGIISHIMEIRKIRPFRVWYYLRQGYSMYLVFIIAVGNMMVTTYYLAIKDVPFLQKIFHGFLDWTIFVISIAAPLSILLGYWHVKRSHAQRSQIEVETEINPYFYKLPPGFWKDVFAPLYLELIRMNVKILQHESLTEVELKNIKEIEKKLELLLKGYKITEYNPNNE